MKVIMWRSLIGANTWKCMNSSLLIWRSEGHAKISSPFVAENEGKDLI